LDAPPIGVVREEGRVSVRVLLDAHPEPLPVPKEVGGTCDGRDEKITEPVVLRIKGIKPAGLSVSHPDPALFSYDPDGWSIQLCTLPSDFSKPHGLQVDPFGRIWVIAEWGRRVGCLDPEEETFTIYQLPGALFGECYDLAIDPEGNVWFVHDGENYIGYLHNAAFYALYLPHFDTRAGWWTGVALKNPERGDIRVKLLAYSDDGDPLGQEEFTLGGYERRTWLVGQGIFSGVETGWIKVVATGPVDGFVLFGRGTMLAGVAALEESGTQISFPHFHQDGQWWTGVALINTSLMEAEVTLSAYETSGDDIDSHEETLPPLGKWVDTVEGIFGLSGQGSLDATTDYFNSLTGFELFGTQDGSSLAGVPASAE